MNPAAGLLIEEEVEAGFASQKRNKQKKKKTDDIISNHMRNLLVHDGKADKADVKIALG